MRSAIRPTGPRRPQRQRRIAVLLLLLSGTVNYFDRSALAIATPAVRHEFGLSATAFGALLSAFLLAYAVAQLPIGFLIDRLGSRALLGAGLAVWSVAQALAALATGFSSLFACRLLLGVGEAPQYPTGARVVADWFDDWSRGLPTGIFNAASSVGPALAPPILTALMLWVGWRTMFVVLGITGLLVAVVWVAAYRDPAAPALAPDSPRRAGGTMPCRMVAGTEWRRLIAHRTTWAMVAGNFGVGYAAWIYFAWLPGYLETQHGVSVRHTGLIAALPPFCGIFGSLFGGWCSDALARRGLAVMASRRVPIVCGLLGMAACTAGAAFSTTLPQAIAFISAAVFCSTVTSASVWALAETAAPPVLVASLGAVQNFGGYLGGACSPVITGVLVDRTGSFTGSLLVGAAAAGLAAVVYLVAVRRPISARADGSAGSEGERRFGASTDT